MAALGHLLLVVVGARAARLSPARPLRRCWRPAAALWLVVAVPSLLQLAVPALLDVAARDPERIGDGQVWRLVTSAVTQDGGVPGTAFNLVVLAVVAPAAVTVLGGRGLWVAFWAGAVGGNLLVLAFLPSVGAGNSIATFTVAAVTVTVVLRRTRARFAALGQAVVLVVGVLLLLARDQHGFSVLVGTLLGLVWPASAVGGGRARG